MEGESHRFRLWRVVSNVGRRHEVMVFFGAFCVGCSIRIGHLGVSVVGVFSLVVAVSKDLTVVKRARSGKNCSNLVWINDGVVGFLRF